MTKQEQSPLLPETQAWEEERVRTPNGTFATRARRVDGPRRHSRKHYSWAELRNNTWTLLHYRTSLRNRTGLQRASYALEVSVLVLISLNVVLAMWYSAAGPKVSNNMVSSNWYDTFLYVSTVLFTVEYLLRLWSCVEDERFTHPVLGRLKWMIRPMSVIDLVVLIPFYLEILLTYQVSPSARGVLTLRGFRLLRIMSFLRLERSYQAMKNLREIFTLKKEELGVVTYLTVIIVLTSATTIFFLENDAQPEMFSSIGTCSWWAIETITSLGYGDIVPVTAAGRAFSSMLALFGIILFTIPGAVLGSGFVEVMLKQQEDRKKAVEETLRMSFTRELHSMSSNVLLGAQFESPTAAQGSPAAPSGPFSGPKVSFSRQTSAIAAMAPPVLRLQEKVDQFSVTQVQLQEQLNRQEAQLQKIVQLLEASLPSTPPVRQAPVGPPFSEIVSPQ